MFKKLAAGALALGLMFGAASCGDVACDDDDCYEQDDDRYEDDDD